MLIHPVFEGFSPVDEDDGNFVRELAPEQIVGFNVNFAPAKATPALELCKLLLHDFTKVTSLAGIHDHFAEDGHRGESSKTNTGFPQKVLVLKSGLNWWWSRNSRYPIRARRYNPAMAVVAKPLAGKVALVTGGAKRLGRASALALAAAGADIAITYLSSAKEAQRTAKGLEAAGIRVLAIRADVTDPKSVRIAVQETVKKLGGIDIVVNNAGAYETVAFDDLTLQQWDDIFAVNVRGPFLLSQAALPHLRRRKGRIINLGSLGGMRPWATHAHYCSSKAALHMLTKSMAKSLAPEIVVNCVAPGMIDLGEKSASEFMNRMAKETPMQRNGTGEDVAAAVLFFATAPTFITGQVLYVDGALGL